MPNSSIKVSPYVPLQLCSPAGLRYRQKRRKTRVRAGEAYVISKFSRQASRAHGCQGTPQGECERVRLMFVLEGRDRHMHGPALR